MRSRSGRDRVSYFTHALTGMAMFAMIWLWGTALFLVPQIVVFSLATLWFLFLVISAQRYPQPHGLPAGHHEGSGRLAHHAGMMAAMVRMACGMLGGSSATMPTGGPSAMDSMQGMAMAQGMNMFRVTSPLRVSVLVPVLALGFGVATLCFISRTVSATAIPNSGRFMEPESWRIRSGTS